MSVIQLDTFKKFNNDAEIKIPGIETTWNVTFDDAYRVKSSMIASQVEKLYRKSNDDDYLNKLLDMPDTKRKERLIKDMDEMKTTCINGLNELLNDGKAGQQLYDTLGHSTEILAQIIGQLNDSADKTLDLNKEEQDKAQMHLYDSER